MQATYPKASRASRAIFLGKCASGLQVYRAALLTSNREEQLQGLRLAAHQPGTRDREPLYPKGQLADGSRRNAISNRYLGDDQHYLRHDVYPILRIATRPGGHHGLGAIQRPRAFWRKPASATRPSVETEVQLYRYLPKLKFRIVVGK